MCKSLERKEKKDRVIGAIQGMQIAGIDKDDIINKIVGNFNVTKKYVLNLLNSQMSDNVTRV